jgi:hypothetical protein
MKRSYQIGNIGSHRHLALCVHQGNATSIPFINLFGYVLPILLGTVFVEQRAVG